MTFQSANDHREDMNKRQEELDGIKKVSAHVKSISETMLTTISHQETNFKTQEENGMQSSVNSKPAEFEAFGINEDSRRVPRRGCWIFILIVFVFISIAAVLLLIFLGNK